MRTAVKDFALANRLYAGATVTFYTVSGGAKTATKATLYAAPTGSTTLGNPQVLGSDGKLKQAVYIDVPTIATIEALTVPDHDTGIINPAPSFRINSTTFLLEYSYDGSTWQSSGSTLFKHRGAWLTTTVYAATDTVTQGGNLYQATTGHTAGAFATDLAAGKWVLVASGVLAASNDLSDVASASTARANLGLGTMAVEANPITTKGDLLVRTSSALARLAVGADGTVLVADSSQTAGVKWRATVFEQYELTLSGGSLLLSPKNGNLLTVNGKNVVIPDAGVTLAVGAALREGGTPAGTTTYYAYAGETSGTPYLILSATGHAALASSGLRVCSANSALTLVGIVRTTAAPAFADSDTQRFVRSYRNRKAMQLFNEFATVKTTTSGADTELDSAKRCEFVCWADDLITASVNGYVFNSTTQYTYTSVGFDGVTANKYSIVFGTAGGSVGYALTGKTLTEGYHYATIVGSTSSGSTGTWGISGGSQVSLNIGVR